MGSLLIAITLNWKTFFLMIKKKVLQTRITFHELNEIQLKWVYEMGLGEDFD